MTTVEQINTDSIKQQIRNHTIEPFSVSELNVSKDLGDNPVVNVGDRFRVSHGNVQKLLGAIGIKENLKQKSFQDPEVRWNALRAALQSCNPAENIAAIVNNNGQTVNIINTSERESRPLDFDNRIDNAVEALDEVNHSFHNIHVTPDARVKITTRDRVNEVDCGADGDIWQSGIEVDLGYNKQEFNSFYLRLICSNGMTTTENTARRQVSTNNIHNQLVRFVQQNDFTSLLKNKVDLMRNEYASVYEANQIASALSKDEQKEHTPWYEELRNTYADAGRPLGNMSVKQQRLAFTNQNLYDVFNTGTYLATHKSRELGESTAMSLNQACANMFRYGPNLKLRTLNPYKHIEAIPA